MFTSSYRPSPYPAQYFSPSSPAFCSRSPWLSWRCASAPPQEPPSATSCPTWLVGGWSDTTSLPGLLSGQPRWTVTGLTFSHTFSSSGLLHFFPTGENNNMSLSIFHPHLFPAGLSILSLLLLEYLCCPSGLGLSSEWPHHPSYSSRPGPPSSSSPPPWTPSPWRLSCSSSCLLFSVFCRLS